MGRGIDVFYLEVRSLSIHDQQHMALSHPDLRCEKCERQFETVEAVYIHYFASPMHPECAFCKRGFKDDAEYSAVWMISSLFDQTITLIFAPVAYAITPTSRRRRH